MQHQSIIKHDARVKLKRESNQFRSMLCQFYKIYDKYRDAMSNNFKIEHKYKENCIS